MPLDNFYDIVYYVVLIMKELIKDDSNYAYTGKNLSSEESQLFLICFNFLYLLNCILYKYWGRYGSN